MESLNTPESVITEGVMSASFDIVEPYPGFCSVGCVMGILNYFLGTTFSTKDTFDVLTLAKNKIFNGKDVLDEYEITHFLSRNGFEVTLFGNTKEGVESYIKNPQKYFAEKGIENYPYVNFDDSVKAAQNIINEGKVLYKSLNEESFLQVTKDNLDRSSVYIFGGDWYIFRNEEHLREDENAGHMVVCTSVDGNIFTIHDPGPNKKTNIQISEKDLMRSIMYYGDGLYFIKVKFLGYA